jgi:hypothetical protein
VILNSLVQRLRSSTFSWRFCWTSAGHKDTADYQSRREQRGETASIHHAPHPLIQGEVDISCAECSTMKTADQGGNKPTILRQKSEKGKLW